jgi:hypothetical protein
MPAPVKTTAQRLASSSLLSSSIKRETFANCGTISVPFASSLEQLHLGFGGAIRKFM